MGNSRKSRRVRAWVGYGKRGQRPGMLRITVMILLCYAALTALVRAWIPAPAAVGLAGALHEAVQPAFFHDDSWLDADGKRHVSQELFDEVFQMISQAEDFILLDMFLFNSWQGPVPETHRALADELTDALVEQRRRFPDIRIIVVSDPINTVYGGTVSTHFRRLREAGIPPVITNLAQLQDSNPAWSGFWRLAIRPFGNSPGSLLPNPFGHGRVSFRSYLALLNFKANHRKLLVADSAGGTLRGLVSSANPHDGSSAHRNVALSFAGPAVLDLLAGERALLAMNGADESVAVVDDVLHRQVDWLTIQPRDEHSSTASVQVLNESRIRDAVIHALELADQGDSVDMAMFYLSERRIIEALKAARSRGVTLRIMLDVNRDAFGRKKNGVPNRPVAAELAAAGIELRWCATTGEQCHAKWFHVSHGREDEAEHVFMLGSANFTRRNLLDLNMETNVLVRTTGDDPLAEEMNLFFEQQWNNRDGRTYSEEYETFADDSVWLTIQYRFMESTGLSTF